MPVRTYSLSGDPDGGVPDQREARVARAGQLPPARAPAAAATGSRSRRREATSCSTRAPDPVLLISAGIGLTPMLAMLHRLADEASAREVWWIHTTHDADSHAFSAEVADLIDRLPSGHSLVYYTSPAQPPAPDPAIRTGRLDLGRHRRLGLPTRRERLRLRTGVASWTTSPAALAGTRHRPALASTPSGSGRASAVNPGIVAAEVPPPHQPPGAPGSRPGGDLRPVRAHDRVVGRLRLGARARRGVRRTHAVVVPHGRLPHLRHRRAVRARRPTSSRRSRHRETTSC